MEEQLLNAWISLNLTIGMEHLVSELPYNESMICNILYVSEFENDCLITASKLCDIMHMHKSQMNRTLNSMEEKGFITKTRDNKDKRQMYVRLNQNNLSLYKKQHKRLISKIHSFIENYGEENTKKVIELFKELNIVCKEVFTDD